MPDALRGTMNRRACGSFLSQHRMLSVNTRYAYALVNKPLGLLHATIFAQNSGVKSLINNPHSFYRMTGSGDHENCEELIQKVKWQLWYMRVPEVFLPYRNPAGNAENGKEATRTPRYLLPCNINTDTESVPEATSVHSLRPSDIRVISTLRRLKIKSDTEDHIADYAASLEETLLRASQFTELLWSGSGSGMTPRSGGFVKAEERNGRGKPRSLSTVSFTNDWKMILIFVAAEDPCGFCLQDDHTEKAIREVAASLDYLHQQLPKTFISLVDLTSISGLYLSSPDHAEIRKSCECFKKPSDYSKAMLRFSFQSALEKLISSERYDTREDFTVALHPVLDVHDSEKRNAHDYGEGYEVQCAEQDSIFFNTHQNSPYLWLKDMVQREESRTQPWRYSSNFTCTNLSASDTIPTSVHSLRPADFKVIAALGDSLTAGNGAGAAPNDVFSLLIQYRGLSWSIGGDGDLDSTTTLPNIFRQFNPDIQGYSINNGSQSSDNARLNLAVPGSKADDMLQQAQLLVTRMKEMNLTKTINYAEDWKLLTIFIGGNDLCDICKDPDYYSPEQFVYRIKQALDYLQQEVPRMFVNLVTILDILPLKEFHDNKETGCKQLLMRALCGCVLRYPEGSNEISTIKLFNKQYQEKTRQLVESGIYDIKEDFTVVIQPFLERIQIPRDENGVPDSSFMAPDCFHFGAKAHALGARGLWKNMFEPVGNKTDNQGFDEDNSIFCPPENDPYVKTANNSNRVYPTIPPDPVYGSKLECTDRSPSPVKPTSVHKLRPADISVVAALGDSLTAGNGIGSGSNNVLDVIKQYRGLSWSIGGDSTLDQVTTLPNILLQFNPLLTGYSIQAGNSTSQNAFFNKAVPGAKAVDMPTQAQALVNQMKQDKTINFEDDWKVITIFIGANDLCASCTDSNVFSPATYTNNIRRALDILHNQVPRAFVNLVEVMDIIPLREVVLDDRVRCPTILTSMMCSCLLDVQADTQELEDMKRTNNAYQQSLQQFIDSGRYDTNENFTVVLQPLFRHPKIPQLSNGVPDITYLAPDCFHMSQKAHSQLARMLWNNMLEPLGQKTDVLDFTQSTPLRCPTTTHPYLRTYQNSDYVYPIPSPTPKPVENWGSDMNCRDFTHMSDSIPKSVHQLRPGDIKVVAALGDSLTAAFGAKSTSLINLPTEWRGISWSIGGDGTLETYTTLPNILKKFNPDLKGFSTGTGKTNQMFNVAVSGAKAENMLSQANALLKAMKESTVINFEEDWKLITLFIGGNDLCQYCRNRERYSLTNHIKHLESTLDVFYKEVPRVFVNLVQIMEVEGLRGVNADTFGCRIIKPNACPCFINPRDGSPELIEIKKFNKDLQVHVAALPEKYKDREDFAAVAQPFFTSTVVPLDGDGQPDLSFFAEDCFHFSERGHAEMAIALWNNMIEPVTKKLSYNNFTHSRSKLKCPSNDQPHLFTLKNSGLQQVEVPSEDDSNQVPMWSVIVASFGGVILGCAIVGIVMSIKTNISRKRKSSDRKRINERGSSF
ncbi:phospholipase B1, membrane-associated [Eleutherodactylus coqui]|uniref:phospholipase B1, membrane-associated n=1 Tax=Eleutherodactylus coqui TaxID=57060 RepID=UPI003462084F